MAGDFGSLGQFYSLHGRAAEAEPLLKRALDIRMKVLGPAAVETRETMHAYEIVLRLLNRSAEAEQLEGQTKARPDDTPTASH